MDDLVSYTRADRSGGPFDVADFSTHVFGAAALCSFGATVATKLLALAPGEGMALAVAGTVGGVLPGIDLKVSWPSRLLFSLLGAVTALAWLFANVPRLSVLELWVTAIALYTLVRYPLQWLFHSVTVHRGALHSLAGALAATLATVSVASRPLGADPLSSWLLGAFVGAGYVLHLVLDEVYSVDFTGLKVKRSFGSALKPLDTDRPGGTCAVLAAALVAGLLAPDPGPFVASWDDVGAGWRDAIVPEWLAAPR